MANTQTSRRNFLKQAVLGGLGLLVGGCDNQNLLSELEGVKIQLDVGNGYTIRTNGGVYVGDIRYNGMNSDKTFAISNQRYSAINVFYPANVKEFNFGNHRFKLEEVNSERITLIYLGKEKSKR